MDEKIKVYLAGPLFTLAERRLNRAIVENIKKHVPSVEVLLPQDFKYHDSFNNTRIYGQIYKACIAGLDRAAIVVAILDGCDSDSGTAFEVGYACAKGLPIIGVRTDYRANQEKGVNLMLSRSCTALVSRPTFDENEVALVRDVVRAVKRILA